MDGERETIIRVEGLSKRFGTVQAVDKAGFSVMKGELFGFLGPNGAGKTTTINMLTGMARPDEGLIEIDGVDCSRNPKSAQHLMGVVPDESNLYPELTGFENLAFCGALYGMGRKSREARARELLELFGLSAAAGRKFAGYSKGMKRKLTIAAGIIHSPPILFLDEPTSGIDVASARLIRRLMAGLNENGTTIFLTTHYIEEAERLCGRIAFIVSGRIVRIDTMEDLMRKNRNRYFMDVTLSEADDVLCGELRDRFPNLLCRMTSDNTVRIESPETVKVGPLVRFFEDRGRDIYEARKIGPSLEELFVEITGIEASAMKQEREKQGKGGVK